MCQWVQEDHDSFFVLTNTDSESRAVCHLKQHIK